MKEPLVIAVSGVKNSGKTRLLEQLLPILCGQGLRVAVIKHDGHRFAPDREGTDSRRMLEAGAVGSAVFDGEKFQLVRRAVVTDRELIAMFPEAQMILLEGFKHSDYRKVEVWRKEISPAPVCDETTLLALVTDDPIETSVPMISPNDPETLAALLIRQLQS